MAEIYILENSYIGQTIKTSHNMSERMKGKKHKIVECPHFNNCQEK